MTDHIGGALARALDQLSFAVLLIAADGRTMFANSAARAALRNSSRILCERWLETPPQAALGATVHVQAGDRPLLLLTVPLPPLDSAGRPVDGVAAMTVVVDPSPPDAVTVADTAPCLGLTPAEWNVARRLGNGSTLDEVARASGVSRNTVRSHLKRVFRKLGMHRQADLVRVITVASLLRRP